MTEQSLSRIVPVVGHTAVVVRSGQETKMFQESEMGIVQKKNERWMNKIDRSEKRKTIVI